MTGRLQVEYVECGIAERMRLKGGRYDGVRVLQLK